MRILLYNSILIEEIYTFLDIYHKLSRLLDDLYLKYKIVPVALISNYCDQLSSASLLLQS